MPRAPSILRTGLYVLGTASSALGCGSSADAGTQRTGDPGPTAGQVPDAGADASPRDAREPPEGSTDRAPPQPEAGPLQPEAGGGSVRYRCEALCDRETVACQSLLGTRAQCVDGCVDLVVPEALSRCEAVFLDLLACTAATADSADCGGEFDALFPETCGGIGQANEDCMNTPAPLEPTVVCTVAEEEGAATLCSATRAGCDDGHAYRIACQQTPNLLSCGCFVDGEPNGTTTVAGDPAPQASAYCFTALGFEACGFPVVW